MFPLSLLIWCFWVISSFEKILHSFPIVSLKEYLTMATGTSVILWSWMRTLWQGLWTLTTSLTRSATSTTSFGKRTTLLCHHWSKYESCELMAWHSEEAPRQKPSSDQHWVEKGLSHVHMYTFKHVNTCRFVTEAPWMMYKDGYYYLFYSSAWFFEAK